jgi:hypothetical protein
MHAILKLLQSFPTTEIKNKKDTLYLSRQDYKFVVPEQKLDRLLDRLSNEFCLLSNSDKPLTHYQSIYFDTDDFFLFNLHRQGKYHRVKIRLRYYQGAVETHYLECKRKDDGETTKKQRKAIALDLAPFEAIQDPLVIDSLSGFGLTPIDLTRQTTIRYQRLALIHPSEDIRISMDFGIQAYAEDKGDVKVAPGHAVLEIKSHTLPKSIFHFLNRDLEVHEVSFSKYCVSLCLLHEELKRNKWKEVIKRYC